MGNMGTPVVVIGNYFRFRVLWYVTEGSPRNNKYTEHQQALICIEVTAVPPKQYLSSRTTKML